MRRVNTTVAALLLASVGPAAADPAAAEALFRDGRELIKAGKLAAGCDKIAASRNVEASVGTLLNLGDCREKLGQFATAWAVFREAESIAKRAGGDDKRRAEAARRATALEPRLSKLVIEVPQPVEGLVIKRDNKVVDRGGWSSPLPVDPVAHVIVAEAPGHKSWRLEVTIDPRSRTRLVRVPKLERSLEVEWSPMPATVIVAPPTTVVMRRSTRARTWSTTRGFAVAIGVLGAGGLVTGAYFAIRSDDLQKRSNAICPTSTCNDTEGLRFNDKAVRSANRANLAFAAGGAAVLTSGVMWLLGKPDDELVLAPAFGDRQAGVSLRGRF